MVLALVLISGLAAYGWFVESSWLHLRAIELEGTRQLRLAHISDLHYSGNKDYLQRVVDTVNESKPDLVCITGDFVSKADWLSETIRQLEGLSAPVYAVPGNWDYWSGADLDELGRFCQQTGGSLLLDQSTAVEHLDLVISGALGETTEWIAESPSETHILLVHYPQFVESLEGHKFDLLLAGHSHGGQVRLPLFGALFVPYNVGRYDFGLFETPSGPLYVTSGIGTSALPIRLGCRPEVAIIDL
jgi:predicted MPP superfamily phosphohydrolase